MAFRHISQNGLKSLNKLFQLFTSDWLVYSMLDTLDQISSWEVNKKELPWKKSQ